jgi:hypothetical protein
VVQSSPWGEAQGVATAVEGAVDHKTDIGARKLFTSYFGVKWIGGRGGAIIKQGYGEEFEYFIRFALAFPTIPGVRELTATLEVTPKIFTPSEILKSYPPL